MPIKIKCRSGTFLIIGQGDSRYSYEGLWGRYWKARVLYLPRYKVDPVEITKDAWVALVKALKDPVIKEKMSDW